MKNNCQRINSQVLAIIAIASALFSSGLAEQVKAELVSQRIINGLFTPTEAQRFFREGRRKFESDARTLDNPDYYFNSNILPVPPELLRPETNYQHHIFLRDGYPEGCCQLEKTLSIDR